jgi:hypothetical protein
MSSALILLLVGIVGGDEVKTKRTSCIFAEAFTNGVETNIDTNGDNLSANLAQGIDNCNNGRFFMQEESEYQAALPAPVTCPAGSQEIRIQQNHGVATDEKTSDQLFFEIATNAATICLNPDRRVARRGHPRPAPSERRMRLSPHCAQA